MIQSIEIEIKVCSICLSYYFRDHLLLGALSGRHPLLSLASFSNLYIRGFCIGDELGDLALFTPYVDQTSSSSTLAEYLAPFDYDSNQLSKEATHERICTLPTAPYIGVLLLSLRPGVF